MKTQGAGRLENLDERGLEGGKTEGWKTGRPGRQEENGLEDRMKEGWKIG